MTGRLYEWNASGMLEKVTNPSLGKITFAYDTLGRRLWKESKGVRTCWLWDGNVPLHEWTETEATPDIDLITWVFDEGGFTPVARLTSTGSESIVTDYLGTPAMMFDADGKKTWSADLDIYGRVRTFAGRSLTSCPFRYQGQYQDAETGLYYNRFRYYDPASGNYISQDPIGLNGGTRLYGYVYNINAKIDPYGLAPWNKGKFNEWFNNASVQDVIDNKDAVDRALRNGGGLHEEFPVSLAPEMKELGFTAEELKDATRTTKGLEFFDIYDPDTGEFISGAHHRSKASSLFHSKLIEDLKGAKTKAEAIEISKRHHAAHTKKNNTKINGGH
jgi:RHS repeat-associated protein